MGTHSRDLWRRAEAIFHTAVDLDSEQVGPFLEQSCGSDENLRRAVSNLLEADRESAEWLSPRLVVPNEFLADKENKASHEEQFGALEIVGCIGKGGMSQVYLANRVEAGVSQQVAVKVIDAPSRPSRLRSFHREQRILALLEHPNIARFLGCGVTQQDRPYVIMEYVEGATLTEYCDRRRLPLSDRVKLFEKVCSAVEHAHRNLVIHCDLKPGNILVNDDGEPKLLDFGIARLLDVATDSADPATTATLERFLTPAYASPEQTAGGPISVATDVYSLGVILYELLTGRLPLEQSGSHSQRAVLAKQQEPEAPSARWPSPPAANLSSATNLKEAAVARGASVRKLRQQLRGDLDTISLACLQPTPQHRYGSVEELRHDLTHFSAGLPISARPASASYRLGKFIRRHLAATALAAVAVVALFALVVSTLSSSRRLASERDTAQRAQKQAEQVTQFLTDAFRSADSTESVDLGIPAGEQATVRQVLDYSAGRIHQEFQQQPLLQASLLQTVGSVYASLGLTKDALPLLRQSLSLRSPRLPEDHPDLATSLNALGVALSRAGEMAEAETTFRQALEICRRQPEAQEATILSLSGLGDLLLEKGHYLEAEELFREELDLLLAMGRASSRQVGLARTNLGGALWLQGDLVAAEPVLRKALRDLEAIAGDQHPNTADALHYLAFVKAQAGETEAAGPLFRRALEIRRNTQGEDHPDTLTSLASLGEFLYSAGDYAAAESILREVVDLDRKIRGSEHPDLVIDLNSLGISLLEQGRHQEAAIYVRQALELSEKIWGEDSVNVAAYRHSLAAVLFHGGQYEAPETLLRQALLLRQAHLGVDHRLTASTSLQLAILLMESGREEEALPLASRAEQIFSSTQSSATQRAYASGTLGAALAKTGDPNQGLPLLRSSLAIFEQKKGPEFRTSRRLRRWLEELSTSVN